MCAGVFWIPVREWAGCTAGVLKEWWNKEEEVGKKGSDREVIQIKMTVMVLAREAERRQKGLAPVRERSAFSFLSPELPSFSLFCLPHAKHTFAKHTVMKLTVWSVSSLCALHTTWHVCKYPHLQTQTILLTYVTAFVVICTPFKPTQKPIYGENRAVLTNCTVRTCELHPKISCLPES